MPLIFLYSYNISIILTNKIRVKKKNQMIFFKYQWANKYKKKKGFFEINK
jgi:hypothetical protein